MADSRGSLCSPKAGLGRIRLLPRRAAYELSCELTQPATTGRREACRKADSQRCYQWTPRLVMASMSRSGDVRSLGLVGADRRVLGLPLSTASDLGSLRRLREPRANLVLRRKFLETRFSDVPHHLDDLAGKCERRFVLIRNRRAGVAADVEAFIGRVKAADLLLEPPFTDCLLAESKPDRAARLELALLVDFHLGGEHLSPRRDLVGRRNAIARFVVVVVLPVKLPVLHEEGPPASEATAAGEHALGALVGYHHLGCDRVVDILRIRR